MRSTRTKRAGERGYSLMELAIVLAIVAFVVAAALLFLQNATDARKADELQEEMLAVVAAAHSLAAGQPDYAGMTERNVAASSLVPMKWVHKGSLVNPYGGTLTFTGGQYLNLWIEGVSRKACEQIGTADFGDMSVSRNANWRLDSGWTPYTPAQAASACKDGANEMGFNFR